MSIDSYFRLDEDDTKTNILPIVKREIDKLKIQNPIYCIKIIDRVD